MIARRFLNVLSLFQARSITPITTAQATARQHPKVERRHSPLRRLFSAQNPHERQFKHPENIQNSLSILQEAKLKHAFYANQVITRLNADANCGLDIALSLLNKHGPHAAPYYFSHTITHENPYCFASTLISLQEEKRILSRAETETLAKREDFPTARKLLLSYPDLPLENKVLDTITQHKTPENAASAFNKLANHNVALDSQKIALMQKDNPKLIANVLIALENRAISKSFSIGQYEKAYNIIFFKGGLEQLTAQKQATQETPCLEGNCTVL